MYTLIVTITIAISLLIAYAVCAVSTEAEYRAKKMREKDDERHDI